MPPINGVDLAWMAMASASLTLGLIHLFVWTRQRERLDFLVFFVLAAAAAVFGAYELQMMRANTPQAWAAAVRAGHVPLAVVVVAIAVFVRLHFAAGRTGLLVAIVGLRAATLGLNFTTGVNVNFGEVAALDHVPVWPGEVVAVPVGTANPWTVVPQLSNLLLLAFVADASLALWRRGGPEARRRAALVGGSTVACIAATGGLAALLVYGLLPWPTILMPAFVVVLLAMSVELSGDVLRAARLAQELAASEGRLRAVVEATPSAILLVAPDGTIVLANPQAEQTFGVARDRLIGRGVETPS
ncbi:MAG: PAS domain S-box protein [Burkholderiales bacterium]|nr:PAS domain S-box protein [Burkholderiales bacterium]